MSRARRIISVIGFVVLIASLALLAASLIPQPRQTDRLTLPSDDLSLPTPQGALPPVWLAGIVAAPPAHAAPKLGRRKLIAALAVAALLAAACGGAATEPATPPLTAAATRPPFATEEPTQPPAAPKPLVTPTGLPPVGAPRPPEPRAVELDYPLRLRVGVSDAIRLALIVTPAGAYLTPTAENGAHVAASEPVVVPNLYDTHTLTAIARLDSIGLKIDRDGDWEQPVVRGQDVTWRWAIAAQEAGRQRANLIIRLRFVPKAGGDILERDLWARTLTIETSTVLGLTAPAAQCFGLFGVITGAFLGFPFADKFYGWLWRRLRPKSRKK